MSGYLPPAPTNVLERSYLIEDGTSARTPMPLPDTVGAPAGAVLPTTARDPNVHRQQHDVQQAWDIAAKAYVAGAISRETTAEFASLVRPLLPGLLLKARGTPTDTALLALSTDPVRGNVPAKAQDRQLGGILSQELLGELGVANLYRAMADRLHAVGGPLGTGLGTAWTANGLPLLLDLAARDLGSAIGHFFGLLLRSLLHEVNNTLASGVDMPVALARYQEGPLFKALPGFGPWLISNFGHLLERYHLKPAAQSSAGTAGVSAARVAEGLSSARGALAMLTSAGTVNFPNLTAFDRAIRSRGFRVRHNRTTPTGRQLMYEGHAGLLATVTLPNAPGAARPNRATLTMELADGQGEGWDHTLCKLTGTGKVIAKLAAGNDPVIETADGYRTVGADGSLRPLTPEQLGQASALSRVDPQTFASRGQLAFPPDFDATGADQLR